APRIVVAGDESRLTGYAALPIDINPYRSAYGEPALVAGAILPSAGQYDLVFDTPSGARPGSFMFRFWVDDVTAPTIRLLAARVRSGQPLRLAVADTGAGVDPSSVRASIDGRDRTAHLAADGTL